MIFSNAKNVVESDLNNQVLTTLETLNYLNQRVHALQKSPNSNANLSPAIDCLSTMTDKIEDIAFKSTQVLHR